MADAKSEAAAIKKMGGKAQKNSGRGAVAKGDAILNKFTVDVKEYAKSYSLSIDNWAKICTDAVRSNRTRPALNVILGEKNRVSLWVISNSDMMEYIELLEERDKNAE